MNPRLVVLACAHTVISGEHGEALVLVGSIISFFAKRRRSTTLIGWLFCAALPASTRRRRRRRRFAALATINGGLVSIVVNE